MIGRFGERLTRLGGKTKDFVRLFAEDIAATWNPVKVFDKPAAHYLRKTAKITGVVTVLSGTALGVAAVEETIRQPVHAAASFAGSWLLNSVTEEHMPVLCQSLRGRVVDLLPGTASHMKYLPKDRPYEYTMVEPNTYLHGQCQSAADAVYIPAATIELSDAQPLTYLRSLPSQSVDSIISNHAINSVDTEEALQQIIRVLKPGGTLYFVEPMAQPEGSLYRSAQDRLTQLFGALKLPVCLNKDIGGLVSNAGFAFVSTETWRGLKVSAPSEQAQTADKPSAEDYHQQLAQYKPTPNSVYRVIAGVAMKEQGQRSYGWMV